MDNAGGGRKKIPALWAAIYKSNIFQDLWITPEAGEKKAQPCGLKSINPIFFRNYGLRRRREKRKRPEKRKDGYRTKRFTGFIRNI
jgi:hypothetical protein